MRSPRLSAIRASAALVALAPACASQQASPDTGITEPVRIESGQFVPGTIPGTTSDAGAGPHVTDVNVATTDIEQGELGLVLSGHATTDAQSVAVRFADMGTGYWVFELGSADPSDDGLLTWQASADFGPNLPPGAHDLVFAAIGASGASGTQTDLKVCLDTPVPDNLNVCIPKRTPPAAVLSLSWDRPVDLDLIVQTPSGAFIGGSGASDEPPDAAAAATGGGVLDRDSNRDCVIDDIDREDVVWTASPPTGTYQVWVDLFSACGQTGASFSVSLWLAEAQADGTQRLVEQSPPLATGALEAAQANGGASAGLYVGSFVLK